MRKDVDARDKPGTTREVVPGRFLHVLLLRKGAKRALLPGHPASYAVMAGLVPAIHVLRCSTRKDVDARDIGAKQSFVASPGHDERDGNGTVTIVRRVPRLPTSSWPGFVPPSTFFLLDRLKRTWMPGTSASPRPRTTTVASRYVAGVVSPSPHTHGKCGERRNIIRSDDGRASGSLLFDTGRNAIWFCVGR